MGPGLILVMGVQRSGTSALFNSLATDDALVCLNEQADGVAHVDRCLRPVAEIRALLRTRPEATWLVRAVEDSARRRLRDLAAELAPDHLAVVWIHRSPVDVLSSQVAAGDSTGGLDAWLRRNENALELIEDPPAGVAVHVVRYEDLVASPAVFGELSRRLGVRSRSLFADDHRSVAPAPARAAAVLERLDRHRIRAEGTEAPLPVADDVVRPVPPLVAEAVVLDEHLAPGRTPAWPDLAFLLDGSEFSITLRLAVTPPPTRVVTGAENHRPLFSVGDPLGGGPGLHLGWLSHSPLARQACVGQPYASCYVGGLTGRRSGPPASLAEVSAGLVVPACDGGGDHEVLRLDGRRRAGGLDLVLARSWPSGEVARATTWSPEPPSPVTPPVWLTPGRPGRPHGGVAVETLRIARAA